MLEGRERTFCSSCLILLLWFCSSAAAHMAGGQHAVHNGLDGGSALTEHTVQQAFHLGEPNPRVRLQAVRLEDVHGPARRDGRAAARLVGRSRAPQQPFSVMAVRSAARGGKLSGRTPRVAPTAHAIRAYMGLSKERGVDIPRARYAAGYLR